MQDSRIVFSLLAGMLSMGMIQAHEVDWMENPFAFFPSNPMVFYYPREISGRFYVDPSYDEPCTVVVNLNASTSTLVNAQVLPPNPENSVTVAVQILRAPSNHLENATITGEWHATGLPAGHSCDATNPNPFSVPITVTDQTPLMQIQSIGSGGWLNVTGPFGALQFSRCLDGPWTTLGIGQVFKVKIMMDIGFFRETKQLGRFVGGVVLDNSNAPVPNLTIGLQYGGSKTFTDFGGAYSLSRLPIGMNWLSITNPGTGANLNVEIANTNNTATNAYTDAMITAVLATAPLISPTNICNCTPWCSIGFATLNGGRTPVYFAGGANNPNGGTPECGQPQVTVTPPVGAPFTISAGASSHHNSGPNPASGVWTVTAVVCGQTKSASITVP